MKQATKFTAFLLAALLLLTPLSAFADTAAPDDLLISPAPVSTVDYYRSNKTLSDWWEALALTAAGVDVKAEGFVLPELDGDALLASGSASALAKAILSLGAIGENPRLYFGDTADRDLIRALAALQGENGAFGLYLNEQIYAMIALELTDPSAYDRDMAIVYLCSCRLADGGFAYFGEVSDVDLTAMALLALQYFRGDKIAEDSIESAVAFLVSAMSEDGSYPSAWEPGVAPSESISAAISGLVAVGKDMTAEPYAKLARKLAEYKTADGGYAHALGEESANLYATYQALLAESELSSGVSAYASFAYDCSAADAIFTDGAAAGAAAKAFETLYNRGIIVGRPVRNAAAGEALTIAELLVTLDRMTGAAPTDEENTVWYGGALARLAETAGIDAENFDAAATVSLEAFYQIVSDVLSAQITGSFADSAAITRGEAAVSLAAILEGAGK